MNHTSRKKFIYPLAGLLFILAAGLGIFLYVNRLLNTQVTFNDIQVDSKIALKLIWKKNQNLKNYSSIMT